MSQSTPQQPPDEPDETLKLFEGKIKDLHAVLVATRNFEINLFWQRANYFLVLNSALAIGFFNLKEPAYAFAFVALGLIASILWLLVCAGGKYWQTRWENRLVQFEQKRLPGLDFFAASSKRLQVEVERGLQFHSEGKFKRWVYRGLVARRFSVSFSMILLAATFIAGWLLVGLMRLFA